MDACLRMFDLTGTLVWMFVQNGLFVSELGWLSICRCVTDCLMGFEGKDFENGRIVE